MPLLFFQRKAENGFLGCTGWNIGIIQLFRFLLTLPHFRQCMFTSFDLLW